MKPSPFAEFFVVLLAVMSIVSSVAAQQSKVTICHKGKNTITVAESAAAAHYAHGDIPGALRREPLKVAALVLVVGVRAARRLD